MTQLRRVCNAITHVRDLTVGHLQHVVGFGVGSTSWSCIGTGTFVHGCYVPLAVPAPALAPVYCRHPLKAWRCARWGSM
jgi:hypothetical protein